MAGFLGAKIHAVLERGVLLEPLSAELTAGYRYPGGLIAWALGAIAVTRLFRGRPSLPLLADAFAPAFAFGMAVVRIGCWMEGCCFGSICDLPWAVRFPAESPAWTAHLMAGLLPPGALESLPVHPLQLYFALLCAALGAALLRLQPRKAYDGQVFLLFVAVHDSGKVLLEFLRYQRSLHLQLLSLAAAAIAWTILVARHQAGIRTSCDHAPRDGVHLGGSKRMVSPPSFWRRTR